MASQGNSSRQKQENAYHQRQVRRGQIIFAVLSIILILSMVLSLLINI